MGGKTSSKSKRAYNNKTYDRITIMPRTDSAINKESIQAAADAAGQSMQAYVLQAVKERMELESK